MENEVQMVENSKSHIQGAQGPRMAQGRYHIVHISQNASLPSLTPLCWPGKGLQKEQCAEKPRERCEQRHTAACRLLTQTCSTSLIAAIAVQNTVFQDVHGVFLVFLGGMQVSVKGALCKNFQSTVPSTSGRRYSSNFFS